MSGPKVVLDTQVLLRGALARTESLTARIYEAWRADQFVLLVSEQILAEVDAVTMRPDVLRKLRVTPREARAVLVRLQRRATLVRPDVAIRMSRDPTDDKFLECAVSGEANYVVSADADLLSLREVRGIPILDIPTFWQRLSERPT
ncbi:MAG: putative toxin-antitoxin system toxin component, PIN family [Candidatus Rokuibacteriota bacterium]|nr:MAG: putative toxin-antitoxin system toxin component, PIN family [Candidatus Rokubacteria bacterium]PYM63016.1 MAG: putative toxin-antitoxin system toxin component, PIN family [Candidatus Rokubacteria bacterium]PYN66446.1 MAG: putative toxin-antitoxin system toxin component, PIN family [Candidatus Rokubacteria bacterium]